MFEIDVALKYLLPKRKQLSVSIISIISTVVISLVVWLILVFFSVTNGLEKIWVDKLITLTAPIRVTPTAAYYNSYYYLVDGSKESTGFRTRSIREKLLSSEGDFLTSLDDEPFDYEGAREERDLVKELFAIFEELPGVSAEPYESAVGMIKLRLVRNGRPTFMNQTAYLGSLDPKNSGVAKALTELNGRDFENLVAAAQLEKSGSEELKPVGKEQFSAEIGRILGSFSLKSFAPRKGGLSIPHSSLPTAGEIVVATQSLSGAPYQYLTANCADEVAHLREESLLEKLPFSDLKAPLLYMGNEAIEGRLDPESIQKARSPAELKVQLDLPLQGYRVPLTTSLIHLSFQDVKAKDGGGYLSKGASTTELAYTPSRVEILLPKSWRDSGVLAGDDGVVAFQAATATGAKEQQIPVVVKGFYDQGIVPIGGRFIFAPADLVATMTSGFDLSEGSLATGVNVRFDDLSKTDQIKALIQNHLAEKGMGEYWQVESYKDYSFTKDLFMQLNSEKNLFGVISLVIILVACSNIISMLIILVNDKKREIGILRSMGASAKSIVAIFGLLGFVMGLLGTLIGFGFSLFTLYHLNSLVAFVGRVQGHELFNAHYFGDTLPTELDMNALLFVFTATIVTACLSGLVPAFKASRVEPSHILKRAE